MPSKSSSQQKLFGMALAVKKGESKDTKGSPANKIASTMSADKIREFARTKWLKK